MSEHTLHFRAKRNYQRIAKNKVVTLKSAVFDAGDGELIEYRTDLSYLHGGYGGAPARVEEVLEGLEVGGECEITLTPAQGYGESDPGLVMLVPVDVIPPEGRSIGVSIDAESDDGKVIKCRVTAIDDDRITLDANHPLAGRSLRFVLEVIDIRPASPEELAAGYAFRTPPGNP